MIFKIKLPVTATKSAGRVYHHRDIDYGSFWLLVVLPIPLKVSIYSGAADWEFPMCDTVY